MGSVRGVFFRYGLMRPAWKVRIGFLEERTSTISWVGVALNRLLKAPEKVESIEQRNIYSER